MARTTKNERMERAAVFRPLFATLEMQGRSRAWLGAQLNIPRTTLYNYEHGERRAPPGFVERVCQILGIPAMMVRFDGPEERFIRPVAKTKNSKKEKNNGANTITARTTQRTRRRGSDAASAERSGDERHVAAAPAS